MNPTWLTRCGGRSFVMIVGNAAVCSLLLWFGKLGENNFTALIMGTVGAFVASMAFQNRTQVRAEVDKVRVGVATDSQQEATQP